MTAAHSDVGGHSAWLMATLGTASPSFLTQQLNSLEIATAGAGPDQPNVLSLNAALALIGAIDPQDELEGALATQMVGCHALSMAMICRAKSTSRTDQLQLYGNLAVKLQRTFTAQVEALARLRGKGQQTVRVEHVTVHPGGQAIVGDVHHHARGDRGHNRKARIDPMEPETLRTAPRCLARTRRGTACQSPAMPNGRCRLHGGPSPGAGPGNRNALKHGYWSKAAIEARRLVRECRDALRGMR